MRSCEIFYTSGLGLGCTVTRYNRSVAILQFKVFSHCNNFPLLLPVPLWLLGDMDYGVLQTT